MHCEKQGGVGAAGRGCVGRGLTSGNSLHAAWKVQLPLVILPQPGEENFDVIVPPVVIAPTDAICLH